MNKKMTLRMKIQNFYTKYFFGKYTWVNMNRIIIPDTFRKTPPKPKKLNKKYEYYRLNGKLESKIILNSEFLLVDGYTSYIIAKNHNAKYVKVIIK